MGREICDCIDSIVYLKTSTIVYTNNPVQMKHFYRLKLKVRYRCDCVALMETLKDQ